jgi:hypothetical protein
VCELSKWITNFSLPITGGAVIHIRHTVSVLRFLCKVKQVYEEDRSIFSEDWVRILQPENYSPVLLGWYSSYSHRYQMSSFSLNHYYLWSTHALHYCISLWKTDIKNEGLIMITNVILFQINRFYKIYLLSFALCFFCDPTQFRVLTVRC